MSKLGMLIVAMVATLASATFAASVNAEPFGIVPDSFTADSFRADGTTPDTQAGAHPAGASTAFEIVLDTTGPLTVSGYVRDLEVNAPPGFYANPSAAPKCSRADFDAMIAEVATCPPESQIGIAEIRFQLLGDASGLPPRKFPVYNVVPLPGDPADIGIPVATVPVHLVPRLDPANGYSIRVEGDDLSEALPLQLSKVTLWGVPGDHGPAMGNFEELGCGSATIPASAFCYGPYHRKPFATNPSSCGPGSGESSIALSSWTNPDVFVTASYAAPEVTGCDRLEFDPSADAAPTTTAPDAPSGLKVDLRFPYNDDPDGLANPPLRTAKVTLPEGMSINPGSADGLQACSDAQLGLGTDSPIGCPDGSKIGSVTAETPLLEERLSGSVYLRSQASSDPASGDMFRLALVLENEERGLLIKLPGSVSADPGTGRLVTEFADNPQLPVSRIQLELKSGPRAPLATPSSCGRKTIDFELSSWAGQSVTRSSSFDIDCSQGLGGFDPKMVAGSASPLAGEFSPFNAVISKPDGDKDLTGVRVELPEGVLAKLKGNLGTQVGTVRAYAGSGSNPFGLPGQVFLEGPYGDAPYSLRVVVPAKAGPFDLGEVVVRQKVYVDRSDASVTTVSDPLPTIVSGVPVRLQRLDVSIDKPGFTINPTSCDPKTVGGRLTAADGQAVNVSNRFQGADCGSLRFTPKLSLGLTGRNQITTGKHPGVRARVTQPGSGAAAIERAKVTLPRSVALAPENAQALCEFTDGTKADLENHCPKASIVGRATATSPLLSKPLSGDVYFVKNVRIDRKTGAQRRTLPMIIVALRGEIAINLRGESSTAKDGRLVNTFANVPDAPINRFNLNIAGGSNGILAVTRTRSGKINLCNRPKGHLAEVELDGHNAKTADFRTRVSTPCGTKKAAKGKRSSKTKR